MQLSICLIMACGLALTSHIYVSKWVKPVLDAMMQGISEPPPYSSFIVSAAYGTALMTVALKVFLYYHTEHLLPVASKLFKILIVTAIILELNGQLIRQPIMDLLVNISMGIKKPFLFVLLNQMDKWVSGLFLGTCLVYLCPKKHRLGV